MSRTNRERKFQGANVPGSEYSWVRKFQGTEGSRAISLRGAKIPGSEKAKERKFQGANWPGSYWPIRSRERIGPGAKRL